MKRTILILTAITFAFSSMLTSCGKDDDKKDVTGVTLSQTTLSLEVGKSATLTATVSPSDAENKSVTWKSSDETVATVSNGTVTAKKEGTATITVTTTDGGFNATCAVTVTAAVKTYEVEPAIIWLATNQAGQTVITDAITFPVDNETFSRTIGTYFFIYNASEEDIPVGTTVKFRIKMNGNALEFTDGSDMITFTTSDLVQKDSLVFYNVINIPFSSSLHSIIGENTLCLEVIQVGGVYSSPISSCGTCEITLSSGGGSPLVKSLTEASMKNMKIKENYFREMSIAIKQ